MARLCCLPLVVVLPIAVFFSLHSMMVSQTNISIMVIVMLAFLISDAVLGLVFWPRMSVKRELPERVRAGQPFKVEYVICNKGRLPALSLELDHELPLRWIRFVEMPSVAALLPRHELSFKGIWEIHRRGVYALPRLSVSSSFPFGILRRNSIKKSGDVLIVHPAFTPLEDFAPPPGTRYQKGGLEKFIKANDAMDFHGCRDFRDGDNPRHIHWVSSARRGSLVSKVFQDEYLSRTALIVDTCVRAGGHGMRLGSFLKGGWLKAQGAALFSSDFPELEGAITLAAAVAHKLLSGECLVDIFAAGTLVRRLQAGKNLSAFNAVLDMLAGIEPEPSPAFRELEAQLKREVTALGSAIVILLGIDKERMEFIQKLREEGVLLKVFLVGDFSAVPDGITLLSPQAILDGKVRKL